MTFRYGSERSDSTLRDWPSMPMKPPSFLARTTLGLPNYLLIAMATLFFAAMAPLGARKALDGRSNRVESWLPAANGVAADQRWFNEQFDGDQFILVSWDDCTLGKPAKLASLARKLELQTAGPDATLARVVSGPLLIDQLTAPPYNLAYEGAIERLEGTFVGPLQRDARGASLGQSSRNTCLAVYMTPVAAANDSAVAATVEQIRSIAQNQCGIDAASLRMAGPAIDSVRIGEESSASFGLWGVLAAAIAAAICLVRLRSLQLAAMAVIPAAASAAMTLALVYYSGAIEQLAFGRAAPLLGVADALTATAPLLVFALTLTMSLRLLYYYRDARLGQGIDGAVERAVADGWPAWGLSALLFAAAMGSLCLSELLPVRRFGLYAGLGMLASVGAVLSILPVWLHRFPVDDRVIRSLAGPRHDGAAPNWLTRIFEVAISGRGAMAVVGVAVLCLAVLGIMQFEPATKLPAAAGGHSALVSDYQWFAERVGHALPMEIVLTAPAERNREATDHPEADGQQYRMTLQERMELAGEVERRVKGVEEVSGSLSAATFMPAGGEPNDAAVRVDLARLELVRPETRWGGDLLTGRELWRISARLAASTPGRDIDYAASRDRLRRAIDPVLRAYEQRDWLVRDLHERGGQLQGAAICVLFRGTVDATAPAEGTAEAMLGSLLNRSGVHRAGVSYLNLTPLDQEGPAGETARDRATDALRTANAVVHLTDGDDAATNALRTGGVNLVGLGTLPSVRESATHPLVEIGGPRPIRAVLTGTPLVATAVSNELTATLDQAWRMALAGLAVAIMCVVWHPIVGLATVAAVLLPAAATLGIMGWLGVKLDMGVALVGGLALGLALDGFVHYVAWFRRGLRAGLFRQEAARMALARCAPASLDATLAVGVGFGALTLSQVTFVHQLGLAAFGAEATAVVGILLMLPAILVSPLGRLLGAAGAAERTEEGIGAIRIAPAEESDFDRRGGRTDVAAATVPAPNHRGRSAHPVGDERHDAIEGPHAALQAKLQRLRRAGE